jgi:hypothetical protein
MRDNYDWASLQNSKIVDVGGGNGHVSIDLARVCPSHLYTIHAFSNPSIHVEVFQPHIHGARPLPAAALHRASR